MQGLEAWACSQPAPIRAAKDGSVKFHRRQAGTYLYGVSSNYRGGTSCPSQNLTDLGLPSFAKPVVASLRSALESDCGMSGVTQAWVDYPVFGKDNRGQDNTERR